MALFQSGGLNLIRKEAKMIPFMNTGILPEKLATGMGCATKECCDECPAPDDDPYPTDDPADWS